MKSFFAPLVSVAAATCLIVSAGLAAADELSPDYQFVAEALPGLTIDTVQPSPLPGFIEVHSGSNIYYMSDEGKFLFVGNLIDVENEENLTEQSKSVKRRAYVERFGDDQSIVFKAANERAEVLVFTDIDCGYCRKLHREIAAYNAGGITIRYLFFPRSGPGSSSWLKAEAVWCAEQQQAALTLAKSNEPIESEPCDAGIVAEHYAVVNELGLSGTPALLTSDGELIIGYRSPEELLEILDLES